MTKKKTTKRLPGTVQNFEAQRGEAPSATPPNKRRIIQGAGFESVRRAFLSFQAAAASANALHAEADKVLDAARAKLWEAVDAVAPDAGVASGQHRMKLMAEYQDLGVFFLVEEAAQ